MVFFLVAPFFFGSSMLAFFLDDDDDDDHERDDEEEEEGADELSKPLSPFLLSASVLRWHFSVARADNAPSAPDNLQP